MKIDLSNKLLYINETTLVPFDKIVDCINPHSDDIIYLGGSLIEGVVGKFSTNMGNRFSDIDVFIIRNHNNYLNTQAAYTGDVRKTYFIGDLPISLDIEVFDGSYIESLVKTINSTDMASDVLVGNIYKSKLSVGNDLMFINEFLNRLIHSICIYNNDRYNQLKSAIEFNKFLSIYQAFFITLIDNYNDDITGNVEAKQWDVALHCVRKVLNYLMSIALMNEGVFIDRAKWVPLKFKNMVKEVNRYNDILNLYNTLYRNNLSDDDSCAKALTDSVVIIKRSVEQILLGNCDI